MSYRSDFPILSSVVHVDGMLLSMMRIDKDGYQEAMTRDLFRQLLPYLQERYTKEIEVELDRMPGYGREKLTSTRGQTMMRSGQDAKLSIQVMLLTQAEYKSLEDRARYGDKAKADAAKAEGVREGAANEKKRIKTKILKVVEQIVEPGVFD